MLKLNSFCRYLEFTCGKLLNYSTLVKNSSQSSINSYDVINLNCINLFTTFTHVGQQFRLISYKKKRIHDKKTEIISNEAQMFKQMSESLQPSINHVSYGGQFDESANEDCPRHEWLKKNCDSECKSDQTNVCVPADFRIWEQVLKKSETNDGSQAGNSVKFKVLSYNVLAQYLLECHPYLYTDCSAHNLKWKVRAERLYEEIINMKPDIICFQEVQASHISSFYVKFEEIGYFGVFKQKTGHRKDGCAIYFKQSIFEMEDHISVEFYQPELPILNRDNIGIMVKLQPNNYKGPPIVVATTHLLYNPKRSDVRLAQLQVLLAEIDRFAFYNNGRQSGHVPIILTGDFNSTPGSAVIKLLDRGHVSTSSLRDSSDWQKIGVTDNCQHLSVYLNRQQGINTDFNMTKIFNSDYSDSSHSGDDVRSERDHSELFNNDVIGHSLKLISTYNKYKQNGHDEATTFQDYWVTVDYIYFSFCSSLRLVERLRLPTAAECDVLGRLPNDVYASDHLALAAVFELKS